MSEQSDTIFDKILRKEIPAEVVFENEDLLAFKDVHPQAPVHVLVIPKSKLTSFVQVKQEDSQKVAAYFQGVSLVAEHLGLEAQGYRVVFNHGNYGGQTVDYIHAHILSGRPLSWPPG